MTQKGLHLKGITLKLACPTKQQRALQIIYSLCITMMIMSTGCYKDNDIDNNDYIVYEIKKGNHYSNNHNTIHALTTDNKIQCTIVFKRTCLYTIESIDSLDQNKLIGLSDGIKHHNNSIRLGWRSITDKDQIQISIYAYIDKRRLIIPIDTVQTETPYHYKITIHDKDYIIHYRDKAISVPRASRYTGVKYRLYPYFGGSQSAPHTMQIHIRWE